MKAIKIGETIVPYEIVYGKYKRLSMKYDAKGKKLVILTSRWTTNTKIEAFIKRKHDWIMKQVSKPWKFVHVRDSVDVFGVNYPVRVVLSSINDVVLTDICTIYTTKKITYDDVEKRLKQFLKKELEKFVSKIYLKVSLITNKSEVKIRYRYMTSRFGVCYPKRNEICLNAYLACFSKKAICAVLFHGKYPV